MSEKIITLEDVRPGDVLLFQASDRLGRMIALLTCSNVSHAGLAYYDKENETDPTEMKQVVHQATPTVTVSTIQSLLNDRDVYVRRLNSKWNDAAFDMSPVVEIGKKYYDMKAPYNWDDLALLAFYYITSCMPFPEILQEKIVKHKTVVESAMFALIAAYRIFLKDNSMICSQFVYDCYQEAKNPYMLEYKDEVTPSTFLERMREEKGVNDILITFNQEQQDKLNLLSSNSVEDGEQNLQEFEELFHIQQDNGMQLKVEDEMFTKDFMIVTGQICLLFCKGVIPDWINVKEAMLVQILDTTIHYLRDLPSPANLLRDMKNLVPVGVILKTGK